MKQKKRKTIRLESRGSLRDWRVWVECGLVWFLARFRRNRLPRIAKTVRALTGPGRSPHLPHPHPLEHHRLPSSHPLHRPGLMVETCPRTTSLKLRWKKVRGRKLTIMILAKSSLLRYHRVLRDLPSRVQAISGRDPRIPSPFHRKIPHRLAPFPLPHRSMLWLRNRIAVSSRLLLHPNVRLDHHTRDLPLLPPPATLPTI